MKQDKVQFIDTTLRDGNQSLWGATGLTTGMMLQIAPVLDRVGYHALDFSTSTHMAVTVRFHKEDPWERLRLLKSRLKRTPLTFLSTGMRFISWETAHPEVMALSYQLLVNNGIERFMVMDPMNTTQAVIDNCQAIAKAGASEIVGALVYTVSPIHDDAFFANMAAQLAAQPFIDRVYLKDPSGLLTPERARTLLPAIKTALGNKPFELHSHCTIGLAPFTYPEAPSLGVDTLHTAARPAANGTSQPAVENVVNNLQARGVSHDLDLDAMAEVSEYFSRLTKAEGLPVGVPQEYDERYFSHQLPGGMIGTMRRQLREIRQEHRLPEVYEEVVRVRAELGYPIMVTPFSQVVGTMAVMNVLAPERYANVPDEVIRYVVGRFGTPPGEVDPNVRDRIENMPRAKELLSQPPMPGVAELRQRFGKHLSDEEFLLRAVMPADQVDAMVAAGPCRQTYNPSVTPVEKLLAELAKRPDVTHARIEREGFLMELRSHGVAGDKT
ncbi:biotin carboxyl carrier protein [Pusillimonas sp. T2]|uniref:biotin carboxyl carrier protein n=1 Tax=Pusillimonas sp. T2 TaxID=1548123 RepID=UPI000B9D3AEC|nr:biotin carboxyl carrier protein [Pusillimonas sp. T2]OXR50101.1 biotin carboxyl carrier protein [Pusillimonas sp. T2]